MAPAGKPSLLELVALFEEFIRMKKQVEDAIHSQADAKRRRALARACERGDLATIKDILYGIK